VNNTSSHDISVLSTATRRVAARVPVGAGPIVMAVHPSGRSLWVSSEGSDELDILSLPSSQAAAFHRPPEDQGGPPAEVAVMGMIHGQHRKSRRWGLAQVRETIRRYSPDVICAEIPPDRWERIWRDWSERGVIEDSRVKRFPEYTDVLLPLKIQMGFEVEPCAGWTHEMSDLRQSRMKQFQQDPNLAPRYREYQRLTAALRARQAADPLVEDDPWVIHSVRYDERTREELDLYDRFLNDWIGPGGWSHINEAHYMLIDSVIRRHRGQRILITFGAGHKYWFLDRLRRRSDIRLLDLDPFLPGHEHPLNGSTAHGAGISAALGSGEQAVPQVRP
ncbi:MAG: YncE family protein, partial [Acidobacteriota bacterium]